MELTRQDFNAQTKIAFQKQFDLFSFLEQKSVDIEKQNGWEKKIKIFESISIESVLTDKKKPKWMKNHLFSTLLKSAIQHIAIVIFEQTQKKGE